ncbi:Rrf2 family transcriptional regulator [Pseudonocardia eucalypti]|uniref:Rrf2 family transcriptional regulator n=1 Tax=Pseudonocardia eucalypti TaxID=648755 RepID=A0ABP9R2A3_9PSEU|nr:Rrf2 family protein [Pseudonocardia eucalypti]
MRVSARADYAVRAAVELAIDPGQHRNAESIAQAQDIPQKFLQTILCDLRRAGIVASRRGIDGGYRLGQPAKEISVADVVRAVDGPLATVRGERPQDLNYAEAAEALRPLWVAMRASVRGVLENVTLADLASRKLPAKVRRIADSTDAWQNR